MATSDYDWHPAQDGSNFKIESTRNLGWWVLLAILVSVTLHGVLYVVLGGIDWMAEGDDADSTVWESRNHDQERLTIDQNELDRLLEPEALPEETSKPENLSDVEDVNLDEFDILEAMKDEVIKMAPVEAPQVFMAESPRLAPPKLAGPEAGSMDFSTAKVLAEDLKQMREQLVKTSKPVSQEQAVMQLNTDEINTALDTDEFFKDALAKAKGNGDDPESMLKGYKTLSEIGEMLGNTGGGLPKGEIKAILPTDILFGYNEFKLKESARLSMMKLAFIVQTNPDAVFIIEGHTDSFGGDEFNAELSLKRASAVRDWLTGKLQIPGDNVKVIGMGKQRPIVSIEGDVDQQSLNRRVEIIIRKK